MLKQLELQRELIAQQEELRRKEEEQRLKFIAESQTKDKHFDGGKCDDWRCQDCNPPPPSHPEYGPPVFDPFFKCWTYPYAQNVP